MNRQFSEGTDGFVRVEVTAELFGQPVADLPEWLDSRAIVEAALDEYRRQRTDAVGGLPVPETAAAFGDGSSYSS